MEQKNIFYIYYYFYLRFFLFLFVFIFLFSIQLTFKLNASVIKENEFLEALNKHYPAIIKSFEEMQAQESEIQQKNGAFDLHLQSNNLWVTRGYYQRKFNDIKLVKPLPQLNTRLYAGYARASNGMWPPQYSTMSTNSKGTPSLGFEVSLWRNSFIDERRKEVWASEMKRDQKKWNLDLTKINVKKEGVIAYWSYIVTLGEYFVYRNLLEMAQVRGSILDERLKAGDISRLIVIENEQYLARRKADLALSENQLQKTLYDLSLFYRDSEGLPILPTIPTGPIHQESKTIQLLGNEKEKEVITLENLSPDLFTESGSTNSSPFFTKSTTTNISSTELKIQSRPDFLALQKQLDINQLEYRMGKNSLFPKIDFGFDFTRNYGEEDPTNAPRIFTYSLKIEIPLETNISQGQIQRANAEKRIIETELRFLQQTLRNEIIKKGQHIWLAKKRRENAVKEVKYAKELLKAENLKNKLGNSNMFLINVREEAVATAEIKALQAQLDFIKSATEYKALIMEL